MIFFVKFTTDITNTPHRLFLFWRVFTSVGIFSLILHLELLLQSEQTDT
jgi:hypothetical protein